MRVWRRKLLCLAVLASWAGTNAAQPQSDRHTPVVLISIDGLKPEYVLEADAHKLKIPNLRRFVKEGAYASGVRGVVPTVTYPSHTTLVTGVSPAKHGIHANTTYDPFRKNQGGWYWYAEDIQVPTLWDAAAAAHLSTANVHWPVTVAARINANLPQYWRAGTADDRKLLRTLATPGLLDTLEKELGPYADGIDESINGDENRAKFAARLIELKRADFTMVYLTALDHEQHATGPFSQESGTTLERIDTALGRILDAVQQVYGGGALVCVVSDHGFVRAERALHLGVAFRKAGLIEADKKGKITGWKGMIWGAGGSAAIVLKDPDDAATRVKVAGLLAKLASDPASGIAGVIEAAELHRRGGFPEAQWLVALRPGYVVGENLSGEMVTVSTVKGMHGYWPDVAEMSASFFAMGAGVKAEKSIGVIDMRAIAPTLARYLGVALPKAEEEALDLN
jgi:predicted AlkP superfamily pyrophosphatase or phosphodiesterase